MTNDELMKVVNKATDWWCEVIQNPKFDAGSDSPEMVMSQIMAKNMARPIAPNEILRFRRELSEAIKAGMISGKYHMSLRCDYGPDYVLTHVAEHAEIPISNFPWKTSMYITDNTIEVRYGYTDKCHSI